MQLKAEVSMQSKINTKLRKTKTTASWLNVIKEHGDDFNAVNVSVAANILGKFATKFKKNGEDGKRPVVSEQQKSEFIESYTFLMEKIEQLISDFESRAIANCARALNNAN